MSRDLAIEYLEEAGAVLEGLKGKLDEAGYNAEELHDDAMKLQAEVASASMRAIDLARRLKGQKQAFHSWPDAEE